MTNKPMESDLWFEPLFHETFDPLYRHLCSLSYSYDRALLQDAEDILQETYALLWSKRRQLEKHPNLPGWLYITATHKFGDRLRKAGRKWKHESPLIEQIDSGDAWDAQRILLDQSEWIIEIVGKENYDLLLRYYDKNVSNEQLAKALGVAPSTLRSRIYRMIQPLRTRDFVVFFILLCNISRS